MKQRENQARAQAAFMLALSLLAPSIVAPRLRFLIDCIPAGHHESGSAQRPIKARQGSVCFTRPTPALATFPQRIRMSEAQSARLPLSLAALVCLSRDGALVVRGGGGTRGRGVGRGAIGTRKVRTRYA